MVNPTLKIIHADNIFRQVNQLPQCVLPQMEAKFSYTTNKKKVLLMYIKTYFGQTFGSFTNKLMVDVPMLKSTQNSFRNSSSGLNS